MRNSDFTFRYYLAVCGICGYITSGEPLTEVIDQLLVALHGRGPDHSSSWTARRQGTHIGLGHTRLSIIDLSDAGNQPLLSPDGRYALSYNGEIFNYRELRRELENSWAFRGSSDTEVLLAALTRWGMEALPKLNGMFAFSLVDLVSNAMYLARSRVGSKPVHYTPVPGGWVFSSTPDSLARVLKRAPDLEYLHRAISTGLPDTNTSGSAFAGVHALPAGNYLVFDLEDPESTPRTVKWHRFSTASPPECNAELPQVVTDISTLLEDSVNIRMRADVEVGMSLSGGLDSGSIATLSSRVNPHPIRAYSYRWGAEDADAQAATRLARFLGPERVDLRWVEIPKGDAAVAAVRQTIADQGAPFASLSVVAQNLVFERARSEGTKVMLGGQGSDEVLMGYRKFQAAWFAQLLRQRDYSRAAVVGSYLARTLWADGVSAKMARTIAERLKRNRASREDDSGAGIAASDLVAPRDPDALSLFDVESASLPTLLRYEDRNSMGHSLETRMPFLDFRLVQSALNACTETKIRQGWGKYPLRVAMTGQLPDEICWARFKRGFDAGDSKWLQRGVGAYLRQQIAEGSAFLRESGFTVDSDEVETRYSDKALAGEAARMREALGLLWLIEWDN